MTIIVRHRHYIDSFTCYDTFHPYKVSLDNCFREGDLIYFKVNDYKTYVFAIEDIAQVEEEESRYKFRQKFGIEFK